MKHFFKILLIFLGMIVLGLIGVFLVSFLNEEGKQEKNAINDIPKNINFSE